jgi:hypothetical protein
MNGVFITFSILGRMNEWGNQERHTRSVFYVVIELCTLHAPTIYDYAVSFISGFGRFRKVCKQRWKHTVIVIKKLHKLEEVHETK